MAHRGDNPSATRPAPFATNCCRWSLRVNSPEARLYLSRQLVEEAVHVQFYLTLLDTYVPDEEERHEAFAAVDNIPSIKSKADFCFRWIDSVFDLRELETREHRKAFLLNLICFAAVIEGLFFYGAFAYVYFLRSEEPDLFDEQMAADVRQMLIDGVDAEAQLAEDLLGGGVAGLSTADMRSYLEHVADRRMERLGLDPIYGSSNPLAFMELQDVQELSNFFERKVSAYQMGVTGSVGFDEDF